MSNLLEKGIAFRYDLSLNSNLQRGVSLSRALPMPRMNVEFFFIGINPRVAGGQQPKSRRNTVDRFWHSARFSAGTHPGGGIHDRTGSLGDYYFWASLCTQTTTTNPDLGSGSLTVLRSSSALDTNK